MKPLLSVLIILLATYTAFAQLGAIKGYVIDIDNRIPVSGVTIQADKRGAVSNQLGYFAFDGVAAGEYDLEFSYVGYATELVKVVVQANNSVDLTVNFKRSAIRLDNVIVSGKNIVTKQSLAAVDIQLRPVNNSQDILKMVPGLFIAQHAGGGKAEQIFLRGYDLDHGTDISISVDGMPVNMVSHAHGQGYADLHFLEPELVNNVVFEKGPYNSNYGNFATTGFVAFSTPDFLKEQYVKIEAGMFNTLRLASAIKLISKQNERVKQQWYASGAYSKTDGYFDKPQNFNRANFFTKYTAAFSNKTLLSVSASSFSSVWNASGQIPQRAIDKGLITRYGTIDSSEGGNTARTNVNAFLQHHFNSKWSLSNRVYYSHYTFNLFSNFTFFLNDPVNGDEIQQKEKRNLYGWQGSLHYNGSINNKNYESEIGYGFRYDDVKEISLNKTIDRVFLSHLKKGNLKETNVFSYWQNTIGINKKLELNTALRYDWFNFQYQDKLIAGNTNYSKQRGVLSPKINLAFSAYKNLKFFVSSGIGFHSNDTRVILSAPVNKVLPKVYAIDAGAICKPAKGLLLKTAVWSMYSEQEFVYVGDEGVVEPAGETRRLGIDLSARYQLNKWLFADLDVNLTKARAAGEKKGNDYVPLAAGFTSIGGLTTKNEKGFSGSLRYRAIGNRPANEDNSVTAEGYILLDALVSYRWKFFEFTLSVQNLLDSDWKEAQFDTNSRLQDEIIAVSEMHFTPGMPACVKGGMVVRF